MAFPTTGVLDNFNRANENPITGWTADIFALGNSALQVVSNAATGSNSGASNDGWFGSTNYGPDCEVYVTLAATPGDFKTVKLHSRLQGPGASTADGYGVEYLHVNAGGGNLSLFRYTNGAGTQLGASNSKDLAAGDAFGLEIIGTTLKCYTKPAAGSWAQLGTSRTDSTYSSGGQVGMFVEISTASMDDFGGGTIASASYVPFQRTNTLVRM